MALQGLANSTTDMLLAAGVAQVAIPTPLDAVGLVSRFGVAAVCVYFMCVNWMDRKETLRIQKAQAISTVTFQKMVLAISVQRHPETGDSHATCLESNRRLDVLEKLIDAQTVELEKAL